MSNASTPTLNFDVGNKIAPSLDQSLSQTSMLPSVAQSPSKSDSISSLKLSSGQLGKEVKRSAESLSKTDVKLEKAYDKLFGNLIQDKDKALKIRQSVTGLPGSIALIVYVIISILILIIINIIAIAFAYRADNTFKKLEKGSATTGATGNDGDSYITASAVFAIILGVIGTIFALILTITFIARFVVKPYKSKQLNTTLDGVESVLGSRFAELLLIIPAGIMVLFFIAWTAINAISYGITKNTTDKEKVIIQETSVKLRDARNGSFALTGVFNGLALVYPIIVSAIAIVYLIVGQVRISSTINALSRKGTSSD